MNLPSSDLYSTCRAFRALLDGVAIEKKCDGQRIKPRIEAIHTEMCFSLFLPSFLLLAWKPEQLTTPCASNIPSPSASIHSCRRVQLLSPLYICSISKKKCSCFPSLPSLPPSLTITIIIPLNPKGDGRAVLGFIHGPGFGVPLISDTHK